MTFLALLELIRLKQLMVIQPEPFEEIEICRAVPTLPEAGPSDPPTTPPAPGPEPEPEPPQNS